jgi:DNA-binding CsgD family transcriptional regulator
MFLIHWDGTTRFMRIFELENDDGELVPHVRLAKHERRILSLLVRCYANRDIAGILGLEADTVKSCLHSLSLGLDCRGRAELVRWVICYPQSLSGGIVPRRVHADGCLCGAVICQIGIQRVG